MRFDEAAVRSTVDEVVSAMRAIPRREAKVPLTSWPAACCEQAACAIAAVLEDRGLGVWLMVSGHHADEANGHSWLVLKDDVGEVLFSIDVTLHQFWELSFQPFVGYGESPARAWFNQRATASTIWEWPWLGDESKPFRTTIRQVRAALQN